jgi:hypothetical protein
MTDLYRVTVQDQKPEHYASLWGAADRWREVGGKAVVEQLSASDTVLRRVPELELRSVVDRVRGQNSA